MHRLLTQPRAGQPRRRRFSRCLLGSSGRRPRARRFLHQARPGAEWLSGGEGDGPACGHWPAGKQPSLTLTPRARTSSRLLKPFRLRLFMSLSSVWVSTCSGQESVVSSGPARGGVPPTALRPQGWPGRCHPACSQLPARETDGHKSARSLAMRSPRT